MSFRCFSPMPPQNNKISQSGDWVYSGIYLKTDWYRRSLQCLAAVGLLVAVVTLTPLVQWWARVYCGPIDDPKGDVLIVLGAAVDTQGMISYSAYLRCQYAINAWRSGGFRQMLITGGTAEHPVAARMADFVVAQGVPRQAILIEERSGSTRENALRSARLVADIPGTRVLLTSDFHMLRARMVFKRAGIAVLPRPIPDALKRAQSWQHRWPVFIDLVIESEKLGYYYVRGWL
jgi:uncharacterized SAM-binding protein YcdF (DUF218 family)